MANSLEEVEEYLISQGQHEDDFGFQQRREQVFDSNLWSDPFHAPWATPTPVEVEVEVDQAVSAAQYEYVEPAAAPVTVQAAPRPVQPSSAELAPPAAKTEDAAGGTKPRPCLICVDGTAGDHNHYGGQCCHSCRVFFRRAVLDNNANSADEMFFSCKKNRTCVIRSKTRRSCKWCRFQTCVNVARMDPDLVRSQDENDHRRDKLTKKRIKNAAGVDNTSTLYKLTSVTMTMTFTAPEKSFFMKDFENLLACNHSKYYDFFREHPDNVKSFVYTFRHGRHFPKAIHSKMCDMDDITTYNYCAGVPDMAELSHWDRGGLCGTNSYIVCGLMNAWFLSASNLPNFFEDFVAFGKRVDRVDGSVTHLLDSLRHLDLNRTRVSWHVSRVYESEENSRDHEAAWNRIIDLCGSGGHDAPSDNVFSILLAKIILFSRHDGMRLENPDKVDAIKARYIKILGRYLLSAGEVDPETRVKSAIDVLPEAKKFYSFHRKRCGGPCVGKGRGHDVLQSDNPRHN